VRLLSERHPPVMDKRSASAAMGVIVAVPKKQKTVRGSAPSLPSLPALVACPNHAPSGVLKEGLMMTGAIEVRDNLEDQVPMFRASGWQCCLFRLVRGSLRIEDPAARCADGSPVLLHALELTADTSCFSTGLFAGSFQVVTPTATLHAAPATDAERRASGFGVEAGAGAGGDACAALTDESKAGDEADVDADATAAAGRVRSASADATRTDLAREATFAKAQQQGDAWVAAVRRAVQAGARPRRRASLPCAVRRRAHTEATHADMAVPIVSRRLSSHSRPAEDAGTASGGSNGSCDGDGRNDPPRDRVRLSLPFRLVCIGDSAVVCDAEQQCAVPEGAVLSAVEGATVDGMPWAALLARVRHATCVAWQRQAEPNPRSGRAASAPAGLTTASAAHCMPPTAAAAGTGADQAPTLQLRFRLPPRKCGVLRKRSRGRVNTRFRSWKARVFEMTNGCLRYSSPAKLKAAATAVGPTPGKLKGIFDLRGSAIRVLSPSDAEADGKEHCLQLQSGTGKLVLQADSEVEQTEWASAILLAMSIANGRELDAPASPLSPVLVTAPSQAPASAPLPSHPQSAPPPPPPPCVPTAVNRKHAHVRSGSCKLPKCEKGKGRTAPRVEQGAESVMIFRVHKGRRAMHAHASTGIQQWRPAQVATF